MIEEVWGPQQEGFIQECQPAPKVCAPNTCRFKVGTEGKVKAMPLLLCSLAELSLRGRTFEMGSFEMRVTSHDCHVSF